MKLHFKLTVAAGDIALRQQFAIGEKTFVRVRDMEGSPSHIWAFSYERNDVEPILKDLEVVPLGGVLALGNTPTVQLDKMQDGEAFSHEGRYYMKTDIGDGGETAAVQLDGGKTIFFGEGARVVPEPDLIIVKKGEAL